MGDSFAGGFHVDEWTRNGITFRSCPQTTSEHYLHVLPLLLSGRVRLIDSSKLRVQLVSLERHVLAGREVVRHPAVTSAHDDVAAAVAGADCGGKAGGGGAGSADRRAGFFNLNTRRDDYRPRRKPRTVAALSHRAGKVIRLAISDARPLVA